MTLRRPYRPLRPDLDEFLFATVGEQIEGVSLSVISALVRLGLDPWKEAGRLSCLSSAEAAEQMARLIAELPGHLRPLKEAREIAPYLVGLLPKHNTARAVAAQVQIQLRYRKRGLSLPSPYWLVLSLLTAAALLSIVLHGGFPLGIGGS
ncbi:MAG TPA: hypothetical protein VGF34_17105 [Stellaceae bacterium]